MIRYCRTMREVRHALKREEDGRLDGPVEIKLVCSTCNLVPATTDDMIAVGNKIYCRPHALEAVTTSRRDGLTEEIFVSRLNPFDGVSRLFLYNPSKN